MRYTEEEYKETKHRYYVTHKEEYEKRNSKNCHNYYMRHRDEIRARQKAYYQAHREEILAANRERYYRFRAEHPELAKKIYSEYARRAYLKRKEKESQP